MGFVNKLKQVFNDLETANYRYIFIPKTKLYPTYYYQNHPLALTIEIDDFELSDTLKPIALLINEKGNYYLNGQVLKQEEITTKLRPYFYLDTTYYLELKVDPKANFSAYFQLMATIVELIEDIRSDYAYQKIGASTFPGINTLFPLRIVDV